MSDAGRVSDAGSVSDAGRVSDAGSVSDAGPVSDAGRPGPIRLARWTVTSGSNVNSRAAVVLAAVGHDWQASAEGNGAVDALVRAVNAALVDVLGGDPKLLEYDVHALDEGPGAEGRVRVVVAPPPGATGERAAGRFAGDVRSTNTIAASVEAYVEALNALLGDAAWAGAVADAGARRGPASGTDQGSITADFGDDAQPDTTAWFNR